MKLYPLRYLTWISLLAIAFSCSSPKILLSGGQTEANDITSNSGTSEKITYKATVLFQDKELSGRLLVKKDVDGNYRLAFFNEMGMTFLEGTLDHSLKRNSLTIYNIIPVLDNKRFLRNFEKSLRDLF